eukprot:COSAG02_NODE_463_length_21833_cov_11.529539_20_plen_1382_part_00
MASSETANPLALQDDTDDDAHAARAADEDEEGAAALVAHAATAAEEAIARTAGSAEVAAAGGLAEMDDAAHASNIRQAFAKLHLNGVGGIVAQGYVIVGYFSNFALLTMVEIEWPSGWLARFAWLKALAFPFKVLLPVDLLVEDVAVGETLALVLTLCTHPAIFAYMVYRVSFFKDSQPWESSKKDKWAAAAEQGGWPVRAAAWLALWLAPATLFEAGRSALGFGNSASADGAALTESGGSGGSGSYLPGGAKGAAEAGHVLSSFTVAWLLCVGAVIVPCVLHRFALRSAYETSRKRNEPKETFFGTWAYAEGSVLLFAYIALHLSVVVACVRQIARFFDEADGVDAALGAGGTLVIWLVPVAGFFLGNKIDSEEMRVVAFLSAGCLVVGVLVTGVIYLPSGFASMVFGPAYALLLPAFLLLILILDNWREDPDRNPEEKIAKWIEEKEKDPLNDRAEAIEALVAEEVAKGDENSLVAPWRYSLVAPFERQFWFMKIAMMLEKVALGAFVVGTRGAVQLWGSVGISTLGTAFYVWKKPMLDDGEDFSECFARGSNTAIVITGALVHYSNIEKKTGEGILTVTSVVTMGVFVLTIGPRRVVSTLTAFFLKRAALQKAAKMDEAYIKGTMVVEQVHAVDDRLFANMSPDQQGWLAQHKGSALRGSRLTVIRVGALSLPMKQPYTSSTLDATGQIDSVGRARVTAWWLATDAAAAVADLNISEAVIGGAGPTLVEAVSASSSLEFITIGKGLRLPLKDNYDSDILDAAGKGIEAGGATVIAWWLTTSAAAAVYEVNVSMNDIGVDGVKALGDVISGSSLKCLIIGPKGTRLPVNDEDVTELNFEGQEFGPAEVTLVAAATSTLAAVADLNISEAIIGDAGATLVEAISASSSLEFITIGMHGKGLRLSLKDTYDSDVLDAARKGIEAGGATVIAWWLTTSAAAAVARVVLSGNMITNNHDKDLSGLTAFCEALPAAKNLTTVDFSNCGIQVKGVNEIAKVVSAGATLNSIMLDECLITGTTFGIGYAAKGGHGEKIEQLDADLSGFTALCSSLSSSHIISISLRKCYLGPQALALLADAIKDMVALNSLRCGNNPGMVHNDAHAEVFKQLTDSLKTSQVTEIDFSSCGIGVVALGHLSDWVRDATAAVARLSLGSNPQIGDEAMVQLLEVLKDVSLTSLDISKTGCAVSTTGKLAELLSGATKFSAAVYEVNISMNTIGVDGAKALGDVISGSSLKCLIIGPKGTRLPVNDGDVTELNFQGQGFGPAEVTLVAAATSTLAALNSLTLDSNGLFGILPRWEGDRAATPDKFAADCDSFLAALKDSKVTTLSLQNTGIGPLTLRKLATSLPAALTEVDVHENKGLDKAAVDALRAAAPETCKILAD